MEARSEKPQKNLWWPYMPETLEILIREYVISIKGPLTQWWRYVPLNVAASSRAWLQCVKPRQVLVRRRSKPSAYTILNWQIWLSSVKPEEEPRYRVESRDWRRQKSDCHKMRWVLPRFVLIIAALVMPVSKRGHYALVRKAIQHAIDVDLPSVTR
jgi:isocitrate dehydrogenase